MKFTISGRIPSKKNSKAAFYNGKYCVIVPSGPYVKWVKEMKKTLKDLVPDKPIEFCSIIMTITFPDRRKADVTNKGESIMDLLVDMEFIEDDNWTCVNSVHYQSGGYSKEEPGVEIEIIELKKPEKAEIE